MSSFKNFAPLLSSLQDQADGKGTIAGSALEDFLSIAGYETPGGGGGGGDSDFSTAEVTLTSECHSDVALSIPICDDEYGVSVRTTVIYQFSDTLIVPLYKGKADVWIDENDALPVVTGDITGSEGYYTVTGNGTITLTENNA